MTSLYIATFLLVGVLSARACYWNSECPYLLHSTKTPYDTIRGDIRDHDVSQNCQAVSIWTLNRHGNRNPGTSVTESLKYIASLKDEIIVSYEAGRSQLCAQDIENFRKWNWNSTLEESQSYLTGTGYEELFNIAARLREKYPHLLQGSDEDYYFRPTNEQRTITSAMAFAHGLTENTNLTVSPDEARTRDDVIRPYEYCDRYQQEVKTSQLLDDQMDAYFQTAEYIAVQNAVQARLGIRTQLTLDNIYSLYELCRFDRSWTEVLQSPWCAAFTNEDLVVLEYRDDIRHFYRNGYGSWVNVNLGGSPLKDLYENFESFIANNGQGRKVVSYFTHDTMLEMVFCAMGIFKDPEPLQATHRNIYRAWTTSFIGAFSVNIIAVLNSCQESDSQSYRVQLFINEKVTDVCPPEGCTWQQFQDKFESFKSADLEFCSMDYKVPEVPEVPEANNAIVTHGTFWVLLIQAFLLRFWR